MYKFFGEPLKEIKGTLSGKVIFRFDHKGEFFTDDPEFIERAKGHFDHIEMKAEEVGERIKKTIVAPSLTITTNEAKLSCKKCNFTCDDQVELMRHYKTEHPKGGQQ